jgi:type II secretory pathway component GspD/PulD (secretin)
VIGRIFHEANISYVVEPGLLHGTVTSRLTDVPLLLAINSLLEPSGLIAIEQNNVMTIKERGMESELSARTLQSRGFADKSMPDSKVPSTAAAQKKPERVSDKQSGSDKPGGAGDAAKTDAASVVRSQSNGIVTKEVPLTHLDPAMASTFLEGLAKQAASDGDAGLRFSSQPYTNTVFLSGSPAQVERAAQALRGADRDPAHVVIEVLVVELDSAYEEELGADLKNLTTQGGNQFTTAFGSLTNPALVYAAGVKNPRGFRAEIQALVSTNKARIIARPYLATASGRKAKIEITKDQYVIVQQAVSGASITAPQAVGTGVKLEILPQVARDGKVRMDVSVEQSQFVNPDNDNVVTEVARNVAQSTMEVESGQAILIGGMTQHISATTNSGLPWLRHVPILNVLFAKLEADSRRQEVLVYLTPYIVWSPDLTAPIPDSEAFSPQEPRDLFSPLERHNP